MLQSFAGERKVRIDYVGLEEKQAFAHKLIEEGDLPEEVIRYSLFDTINSGCSIGANRNALLLYTPGELLFGADDDTECQIAPSPRLNMGLAFNPMSDFMQIWSFPDREAALQSVSFVNKDVLAIHVQLLGRELKVCLADPALAADLEFRQVNTRQLRAIVSGDGRVATTFTGLIGDSGMPTPLAYLLLDHESHDRLVKSDKEYLTAMTSREIFRVVDRPVIGSNAWCVTTTIGFDNRRLLPPFMPMFRGEDDVYGATLGTCFDNYFCGHLPYAIAHLPEGRGYYPRDYINEFASNLLVCSIIATCMVSFSLWDGMMSDSDRLRMAGKFLMEIAQMSQTDFEEYLRLQVVRMHSITITMLEAHLQKHGGSPRIWAEDLEKYIDALQTAPTNPDFLVPRDMLALYPLEEARNHSRLFVGNYGKLLYWWPEIVEAAKSLVARYGDGANFRVRFSG